MTNIGGSGNQTRTSVLQKHVHSHRLPPEQAANGPTPSQPVSINTRQQAEIPMSPNVTFTEPSTSAGIFKVLRPTMYILYKVCILFSGLMFHKQIEPKL